MRLVYLVGEPGAGKSTLADAVLTAPIEHRRSPFAHRVDADRVHALGPAGAPFGGTDKLSMGVQPKVVGWLAGVGPSLVLGEGDRLANLSFLRVSVEIGYEAVLVAVSVPEEVGAARRARRAEAHDTGPQNASWVQGRRTKVANLLARWEGRVVELDGTRPVEELVPALRAVLWG